MKAFRSLRILISISRTETPYSKTHLPQNFIRRSYSAQPNLDEPTSVNGDSVFDGSQYSIEDPVKKPKQPNWDKGYRERVQRELFPQEKQSSEEEEEDEDSIDRSRILAKALLEAALESADDELGEGEVREEDQKSLNVGIIGPPNAGKSSLTNFMVRSFKVLIFNRKVAFFGCMIVFLQCAQVGTKVAAASRKTNTTTHEVLGVLTKGDTQVVSFLTSRCVFKYGG